MKPIHRSVRTVAWIATLAAAFLVTHTPPPQPLAPPLVNDKVLHFAGFTALGLMTIWRLSDSDRRFHAKALLLWIAFLAAYGLFDEVTQPIFQRSFEWLDWVADMAGACLGTAFAAAYHHRALRGRTPRPQ